MDGVALYLQKIGQSPITADSESTKEEEILMKQARIFFRTGNCEVVELFKIAINNNMKKLKRSASA